MRGKNGAILYKAPDLCRSGALIVEMKALLKLVNLRRLQICEDLQGQKYLLTFDLNSVHHLKNSESQRRLTMI